MNVGNEENLIRLYKEILKDWFMGLLDFKSYCEKKRKYLRVKIEKSGQREC